jgi:predicted nucleic acid-binding protein
VNGYLMDTNHVVAWEAQNPPLIAKLTALPPNTLVYTSAITLGEITAGHEMTPGDPTRRQQAKAFLNIYAVPDAVAVTHYTEWYYGRIIGRIWKRTPPAKASISTDAHLVSLGVNINDVWIVACAWEHGLILLTTDKMDCIREVVPEVTWENWL